MKFLIECAYIFYHFRLLIFVFILKNYSEYMYILDFGVDNYSVFSGEVFGATGLSFSMLLLDSELGLVG